MGTTRIIFLIIVAYRLALWNGKVIFCCCLVEIGNWLRLEAQGYVDCHGSASGPKCNAVYKLFNTRN